MAAGEDRRLKTNSIMPKPEDIAILRSKSRFWRARCGLSGPVSSLLWMLVMW